mmetsp:Transcript_42310/g.75778  ORF Transcript_42310/g.75778 Transcript_42310/m.75778 type:complete len:223 (-) Transcript_42310:1593-2261(-)
MRTCSFFIFFVSPAIESSSPSSSLSLLSCFESASASFLSLSSGPSPASLSAALSSVSSICSSSFRCCSLLNVSSASSTVACTKCWTLHAAMTVSITCRAHFWVTSEICRKRRERTETSSPWASSSRFASSIVVLSICRISTAPSLTFRASAETATAALACSMPFRISSSRPCVVPASLYAMPHSMIPMALVIASKTRRDASRVGSWISSADLNAPILTMEQK